MSEHRPAAAELLLSSRPLSWVNTAYPFGAAYLLGGGGVDLRFILGAVFFLIPYNLAMYGINDVFDYESDLRNPRKGGVEGAVLDRSRHRMTLVASVVTCVPFLVYLLASGTLASGVALAVVMFAVVAYSARGLRFKEVPFLDSATSSTHFVGPAVFGLLLAGGSLTPVALAALGAFFLWGMASQAFGAVQDIVPDREGDLASIATVLGARRTVRFALAAYAGAGALMLLTPWPYAVLAAVALPYLVSIWPYRSLPDERSGDAHAGWSRFLWLNYGAGAAVTIVLLWGAVFVA